MFCKTCGKQIDRDSLYCSFCGAKQSQINKPEKDETRILKFPSDNLKEQIKPKLPNYVFKILLRNALIGLIISILLDLLITYYAINTGGTDEFPIYLTHKMLENPSLMFWGLFPYCLLIGEALTLIITIFQVLSKLQPQNDFLNLEGLAIYNSLRDNLSNDNANNLDIKIPEFIEIQPVETNDLWNGKHFIIGINFENGLKGEIYLGRKSGKYFLKYGFNGILYFDTKTECIAYLYKHNFYPHLKSNAGQKTIKL